MVKVKYVGRLYILNLIYLVEVVIKKKRLKSEIGKLQQRVVLIQDLLSMANQTSPLPY